MKRIIVVAGTRPEIIKIAPIIRKLKERKSKYIFVYTGQHYDHQLSSQIITDLELPSPDYNFKLKSKISSIQIAEIMTNLEKISKAKNDIILVQGDTNSVLAASLFAIKQSKKLVHVEAGLRSFDWKMPEEHNRRMVDHISDYLLAPTKESKQNLVNEKVNGKIYVTGNTVMDAVKQHIKLSEKKSVIQKFKRDNKLDYEMNEVIVGVGGKQCIFNLFLALLNSGDEVIVPTPYWVSYTDIVEFTGGTTGKLARNKKGDHVVTFANEDGSLSNIKAVFESKDDKSFNSVTKVRDELDEAMKNRESSVGVFVVKVFVVDVFLKHTLLRRFFEEQHCSSFGTCPPGGFISQKIYLLLHFQQN